MAIPSTTLCQARISCVKPAHSAVRRCSGRGRRRAPLHQHGCRGRVGRPTVTRSPAPPSSAGGPGPPTPPSTAVNWAGTLALCLRFVSPLLVKIGDQAADRREAQNIAHNCGAGKKCPTGRRAAGGPALEVAVRRRRVAGGGALTDDRAVLAEIVYRVQAGCSWWKLPTGVWCQPGHLTIGGSPSGSTAGCGSGCASISYTSRVDQ